MKITEAATLLATLGLSCFLTASNLSAMKVVEVYNIHLTAGFFTYPFVYFFSAIIIAIRSPRAYYQCIIIAYIGYLTFISLMYLSSIAPGLEIESNLNQSFNSIYSLSNYRVYLSSLCAYFISMFLFGVLFSSLKIKSIAYRITVSTFIVALVDVKLFLTLAFFGVKENNLLFSIMLWSSITKLVAQLIFIPPTIFVINAIRNKSEYYVGKNEYR